MTEPEQLTEKGRTWAEPNAVTSIVANVALYGAENWPQAYVDAAVRVANGLGAGEPVGTITLPLELPVNPGPDVDA